MAEALTANIPAAASTLFYEGIAHPDLWLWDSWTLKRGNDLHLYCLALSRAADDGSAISPGDRNNYPFHVRHFLSHDNGQSWKDMGNVLSPSEMTDGSDARNIWSGSITAIDDSTFLFSHTGIRSIGENRPFIQSINATISSDPGEIKQPEAALLCPLRDYDLITEKGYYLGPNDDIGYAGGDDNGPITAWRDPFTFMDPDGEIHMFISAKIDAATPAVGHALITVNDTQISLKKLLPPITLPDADLFTQAEVPKIYHDQVRKSYYMLISACNRLNEDQPDSEISKELRLYKAKNLSGPWTAYSENGSLLPGFDYLFGASAVGMDFDTGQCKFIAPYTEMNPEQDLQLTFAPLKTLNIFD